MTESTWYGVNRKAPEACDITEALIDNTDYVWGGMDTETPEIIS